MPKAFTESEKKLITDRLLEQGHKHFSAFGLRKTSVEELATGAGISKGAFYLFYESKESLLMDVVEEAELNFRQSVLKVIEEPGSSPRARLVAVFQKAFSLWKTIPILRIFTQGDYELLSRRVPAEKLQRHMESDQEFITELISRCQRAGIPIQAAREQISGLMYAAFFTSLHEDDFGPGSLTSTVNLLLELIAAFCLGEIELEAQDVARLLTKELNEQNNESRN